MCMFCCLNFLWCYICIQCTVITFSPLPTIPSHPFPLPLVLIFFPTSLCFIPMSFFSYFFPGSLQAVTCSVFMIAVVTSHQLTASPVLPSEGSRSPSKPSCLLFSPLWLMSSCSDPCSSPKEASFFRARDSAHFLLFSSLSLGLIGWQSIQVKKKLNRCVFYYYLGCWVSRTCRQFSVDQGRTFVPVDLAKAI